MNFYGKNGKNFPHVSSPDFIRILLKFTEQHSIMQILLAFNKIYEHFQAWDEY